MLCLTTYLHHFYLVAFPSLTVYSSLPNRNPIYPHASDDTQPDGYFCLWKTNPARVRVCCIIEFEHCFASTSIPESSLTIIIFWNIILWRFTPQNVLYSFGFRVKSTCYNLGQSHRLILGQSLSFFMNLMVPSSLTQNY
jgi:hypothetical protein